MGPAAGLPWTSTLNDERSELRNVDRDGNTDDGCSKYYQAAKE
jgi:hypothetical protein